MRKCDAKMYHMIDSLASRSTATASRRSSTFCVRGKKSRSPNDVTSIARSVPERTSASPELPDFLGRLRSYLWNQEAKDEWCGLNQRG